MLAERVWDSEDIGCLALVEHVHVKTGLGEAGKDAFQILDKAGQQFMNVRRSSMELITPYSHLKNCKDSLQPMTSWMFVKKNIDAAFDTLVATANHVHLERIHRANDNHQRRRRIHCEADHGAYCVRPVFRGK